MYSYFARKIVTAVPSHTAHLSYFGPMSIVIIGSYLNSNMTIQTCLVKYLVAQDDILCVALNLLGFDSL